MKEERYEDRIRTIFDSVSGQYDMMNTVISAGLHKRWRRDAMKKMALVSGTKALDVCCGTADWTIALAKVLGEDGEVIGLDFSENMLRIAREKVRDQRLENVRLLSGNALHLPFQDESFEYVTIGFGLRNVKDRMQVLREMHRVLKPGGTVACLETSQPTLPIFKQAYYVYFRWIMPFFGKIFARRYREYAWLNESARRFPGREELAQLFRKAGFSNVVYYAYCGGVAALHLAQKR